MKKALPVLIVCFLVALSEVSAQKTVVSANQHFTKMFSTKMPTKNSDTWIEFSRDSLLCCLNEQGFVVVDYTSGNILMQKTYAELGSKIINSKKSDFIDHGTLTNNENSNAVIISDYKNSIASIDLKNGKVMWETNSFNSILEYLIIDRFVIVFDKTRQGYPISCLDIQNGKSLWVLENKNRDLTFDMFSGYLLANSLFISYPTKKISKGEYMFPYSLISTTNGETGFTFDVKGERIEYQYTATDVVYFITKDSSKYKLIKIDALQKKRLWEHNLQLTFRIKSQVLGIGGGPVNADISVKDGIVLVKSDYGIEILDEKTGEDIYLQMPADKTDKKSFFMHFENSNYVIDNGSVYFTCKHTGKKDYFLSKVDYKGKTENWSDSITDYSSLRQIYKTRFGILIQYGGIFKDINYYYDEPSGGCSLEMVDENTGKTRWKFQDKMSTIYSVSFDNDNNVYLFSGFTIWKISLETGATIYQDNCNALYWTSTPNKNSSWGVTIQSNLDKYFVDLKRKMLITFDFKSVTGYKFD